MRESARRCARPRSRAPSSRTGPHLALPAPLLLRPWATSEQWRTLRRPSRPSPISRPLLRRSRLRRLGRPRAAAARPRLADHALPRALARASRGTRMMITGKGRPKTGIANIAVDGMRRSTAASQTGGGRSRRARTPASSGGARGRGHLTSRLAAQAPPGGRRRRVAGQAEAQMLPAYLRRPACRSSANSTTLPVGATRPT
jgi:hypothetical protein